MCNSTTRCLLINVVLLCCFLSTACAGGLSHANIACIENILDGKVVRVDNKNQRLFVVNEKLTAEIFSAKLRDIKSCISNSAWDRDWAISVFTQKKYAGYKDEKNIIPLHKNNEWAKAYKIEYLNSEESVIADPAINPRKIKP